MIGMTARDLPEIERAIEDIRTDRPRVAEIFEKLVAPHVAALDDDWITTGQAAAVVGVSVQTIRNWVDAGWLASRRANALGRREVRSSALRDVARFRDARQGQKHLRTVTKEQAAEALRAHRKAKSAPNVGGGR